MMWEATLNGKPIACALKRETVIGVVAGVFRHKLEDVDFVTRLRLSGLELHELLPAKPIEGNTHHPAPTIDFISAKRLIAEQWLPVAEEEVGTAVHIVDELCVEYDWGWVIHWRPIDPKKGDPDSVNRYHWPFTVDCVTGNTGTSGGTRGLRDGIVGLLQQRPPELCGPYPPGKQHFLIVADAFEAAGAFTPVGVQSAANRENS
jgi:hypothetical protein